MDPKRNSFTLNTFSDCKMEKNLIFPDLSELGNFYNTFFPVLQNYVLFLDRG